jgi:hypothetical protein
LLSTVLKKSTCERAAALVCALADSEESPRAHLALRIERPSPEDGIDHHGERESGKGGADADRDEAVEADLSVEEEEERQRRDEHDELETKDDGGLPRTARRDSRTLANGSHSALVHARTAVGSPQ